MPILIQDPATLDVLRERGCLLADDSVNRDAVVGLVVAELEANHVAHAVDDVDDVAVAAGQLTKDIFGADDKELSDYVAKQLSTTTGGQVQKALSNGYMLCGARSKFVIPLPGGQQQTISLTTRFLTDDPDTISRYVLEPTTKKAVAVANRTSKVADMVTARRPEMAERVGAWNEQLLLKFQTSLTAGSGE